jgi:hypothetical protein
MPRNCAKWFKGTVLFRTGSGAYPPHFTRPCQMPDRRWRRVWHHHPRLLQQRPSPPLPARLQPQQHQCACSNAWNHPPSCASRRTCVCSITLPWARQRQRAGALSTSTAGSCGGVIQRWRMNTQAVPCASGRKSSEPTVMQQVGNCAVP